MPKKICNHPACREIIKFSDRYCLKHGVTKDGNYSKFNRNKERDKFYHSKAWKTVRTQVMEDYNYLCQRCKDDDKIVTADVVDHIVEISDGGEDLDIDNLEPLCHYHHNTKTQERLRDRNKIMI